MTSDKGFMTVDGRVVRSLAHPDAIGAITYHEQRYNLRRVYVDRRQGVEYHVTRTATQAHIVKAWNPADATSVSLDYTITADGTVYHWHVDPDDRRYRVRHPSSAR